jgi:hypothetical protein
MKSFNDNWDGIQRKQVTEQFKAGDKVKVPHKGRMVSGKIVRFDSGGTDKARQHGGGYVVDVGDAASILVPKEKVQKEEVEQVDEVMSPQEKAKQDAIDARIRKLNTDIAVDQIKEILRSYTHDKKQREMIIAAIKQIKEEAAENWDGVKRNNTINEAADLGKYWTDLDDMATNIQKEIKSIELIGMSKGCIKFDVASYLLQIVGSLRKKHAQQHDFLQGLIHSLEAVHKKTSAPSKHGNMEILNDLSTVIRELKKYQK